MVVCGCVVFVFGLVVFGLVWFYCGCVLMGFDLDVVVEIEN